MSQVDVRAENHILHLHIGKAMRRQFSNPALQIKPADMRLDTICLQHTADDTGFGDILGFVNDLHGAS